MRSSCWKYLLLIIFIPLSSLAQDFSWWNDNQSWDGQSHWSTYMKLSPAFMGPNAFPIPFAERMVKQPEFEIRYSNHSYPGEVSWDVFSMLSIPIGDRASLRFQMNPLEYFQMDTVVRDERIARDEFPSGYASGDLLVQMNALVIGSQKTQLLFNLGLKTASGSQFRNGRYTDSPAYYFNLSYHRYVSIHPEIRLDFGVLMGLYVWQTYMQNNRQNDAFLAAFSCQIDYKKVSIVSDFRGFTGYLDNGDSPLLYSIKLSKNQTRYQLFIRKQFNLHDYPYESIQLGSKYYF